MWLALGWRLALLFALMLPVSGLIAYRYLVGAGRLRSQFRLGMLALRQGAVAKRLVAERQELMAKLERAKNDYMAASRRSTS